MFVKYNEKINENYLEFQHCKIKHPFKKTLFGKFKLKYNKLNLKNSIYISISNYRKLEETNKIYNVFDIDVYHPNGGVDCFDYYGVNYYTREQANKIYKELSDKKIDKELLEFLKDNIDKYNGFYILGI